MESTDDGALDPLSCFLFFTFLNLIISTPLWRTIELFSEAIGEKKFLNSLFKNITFAFGFFKLIFKIIFRIFDS